MSAATLEDMGSNVASSADSGHPRTPNSNAPAGHGSNVGITGSVPGKRRRASLGEGARPLASAPAAVSAFPVGELTAKAKNAAVDCYGADVSPRTGDGSCSDGRQVGPNSSGTPREADASAGGFSDARVSDDGHWGGGNSSRTGAPDLDVSELPASGGMPLISRRSC